MTSHLHAAVWLDHHQARIFHVDREGFDEAKVRSPQRHVHRHPKGSNEAREHPDDRARFFEEVARALVDAERILVVGPSTASCNSRGTCTSTTGRSKGRSSGSRRSIIRPTRSSWPT